MITIYFLQGSWARSWAIMHYARVQREKTYGLWASLSYQLCILNCNKFDHFQLDCGIHPGLSGMDALPFIDTIEADQIDLLLISQYV